MRTLTTASNRSKLSVIWNKTQVTKSSEISIVIDIYLLRLNILTVPLDLYDLSISALQDILPVLELLNEGKTQQIVNRRRNACYVLSSLVHRKTSNISRTLVGNKIADNSDVVGASPVGAAPTTSSFST